MLWKKPANLKYTDLCIYIDSHIPDIVNPGENPEVEDTVYNYLWLLVKALAIKKCMFNEFQDYDPFAFYAANRLYFAIRKNYWNQGKTIKGKQIRPIKSCLNYTKALLYPMKIEYQNETFKEIISEEFVSKKFDAFTLKERMKAEAKDSQGTQEQFKSYLLDSFKDIGRLADNVLIKSPFTANSAEYKYLRMSLLLNALNSLSTKKRLNSELVTIILWKLPKSMTSYVRVLLKEFYTEIKLEILDCHKLSSIDDNLLDKLIQARTEEFESHED